MSAFGAVRLPAAAQTELDSVATAALYLQEKLGGAENRLPSLDHLLKDKDLLHKFSLPSPAGCSGASFRVACRITMTPRSFNPTN
jgi:hypothetical protein